MNNLAGIYSQMKYIERPSEFAESIVDIAALAVCHRLLWINRDKLVRSKIAMNTKLVDSLAQIIQTLTDAERKELDIKLSTPAQNSKITDRTARFQQWDRLVSDADAATLKAEFAQEDMIFAETILPEYSSNLQQEDYA